MGGKLIGNAIHVNGRSHSLNQVYPPVPGSLSNKILIVSAHLIWDSADPHVCHGKWEVDSRLCNGGALPDSVCGSDRRTGDSYKNIIKEEQVFASAPQLLTAYFIRGVRLILFYVKVM